MDTYCQKLHDLANQLGDVGHLVSEESLVLQLVRGLPKEFDVLVPLPIKVVVEVGGIKIHRITMAIENGTKHSYHKPPSPTQP